MIFSDLIGRYHLISIFYLLYYLFIYFRKQDLIFYAISLLK